MVVWSAWSSVGLAGAQTAEDDALARAHFERGRAAFEAADWNQALMHFRDAYRLSHRAQLLYNIGVAADRLRYEEEALEAFERYVEEVEQPPREQEVRQRIVVLRQTIAQKKEKERALAEAALRSETSGLEEGSAGRKISKSAIIGSSILGAVGVAGVVTMAVGLARSGQCLTEDAVGVCQSERAPSAWTPVYGAVGIAALAGSATWLVVSSKRSRRNGKTAWMLSPTGVFVSGSF